MDDYGYLYVNGSYVGQGSAVVELAPGTYTVTDYSPSTGKLCWQTSIRVNAGYYSRITNNTWCR
ncbi:MAG: hypothetical protein NTZ12_03965 [Candidatus Aminicenantes bacterium]|nr:hypothetical protein [Candidatus Aminicenantes bacterium]